MACQSYFIMACQLYFIFLTVQTHDARNVYRLLPSMGLTQACPNYRTSIYAYRIVDNKVWFYDIDSRLLLMQ